MDSKRPKSPRFDVSKLSLERRQRILAQNPGLDPRALGLLPDPDTSPTKAPAAPRGRARKAWRGTIGFDSETEANVYDRLVAEHIAVIAHGKIALGDEAHLEPDFIIVHEVYDDGRFEGQLADAKGLWKYKTKGGQQKTKPHAEKDWLVKVKWLRDKVGLIVSILTR